MGSLRIHRDEVKMCNCAGCGRELVGQSMCDWWTGQTRIFRDQYPLVAGRIYDRPYCSGCIAPARGFTGF